MIQRFSREGGGSRWGSGSAQARGAGGCAGADLGSHGHTMILYVQVRLTDCTLRGTPGQKTPGFPRAALWPLLLEPLPQFPRCPGRLPSQESHSRQVMYFPYKFCCDVSLAGRGGDYEFGGSIGQASKQPCPAAAAELNSSSSLPSLSLSVPVCPCQGRWPGSHSVRLPA